MHALVLLIFSVFIPSLPAVFQKHTLSSSPTAVCFDGSPAVYYLQQNLSVSSNWLLWVDGPTNPAWSSTVAKLRDPNSWPDTIKFTYGPFSKGGKSFSDYSMAVLIYCSEDFFLGNSAPYNGYNIFSAWLSELKPLMTGATRVVTGGATVGALGLVANNNLVYSSVPLSATVSFLLDSAFFTPTAVIPDTLLSVIANSPAPSCSYNETKIIYSAHPFVSVPCCVDFSCSSASLPKDAKVLLLQSLAYSSSVNNALLFSSGYTGQYTDSQVYNLSLVSTSNGAQITSELRQNANDRTDATSYIAYSCIEAPILSPFGAAVCPTSGYTSGSVELAHLDVSEEDEIAVSVQYNCASSTQTLTQLMGDYSSEWTHTPGTWEDVTVSISGTPNFSPSIATLVDIWMGGSLIIAEESCQGMNCNPSCVQSQITLRVTPYEHISFVSGLFMLIVLGMAALGLWIVYFGSKTVADKNNDDYYKRGGDLMDLSCKAGDDSPPVDHHLAAARSMSVPTVLQDSSALSKAIAAKRSIQLRGVTYWNTFSMNNAMHPPALKSVSLTIPPGSLVAIIGGSGAGKSTLLELMAGRRASGSWCGDILISGKKVTSEWLARNTGIVRQNMSPLVNELTLIQNLEFAAMLRIRGSIEFIRNRIDFVLNRLELLEFRNCVTSTLSGGQRKRAEVALELLTQPDILFLDEPTSALDSRTALNFMNWVAKVSQNTGSTLILSIHQPREEIWSLFTHVIILEQGFLMYFGHPFSAPSSSGSGEINPADLAVELAGNQRENVHEACDLWCRSVVGSDRVERPAEESCKKTGIWSKWRKTPKPAKQPNTLQKLTLHSEGKKRAATIDAEGSLNSVTTGSAAFKQAHQETAHPVGPTPLCQVRSFMLRAFAVNPPWRVTTLRSVVGLSLLGVCVSLLLGVIFWSLDSESVRTKALAFLVLVPAFLSNSFVVSFICDDMNIFFIERSNYYVSPIWFFLHHILHLTIYVILPFSLFPFVQYFLLWGRVLDDFNFNMFLQMVGFAQICFVAFLSLFVFSCFLLKGKQSNAMIMNSSLESFFALFSGFLAPLPSLTLAPIRYLTYLSPALWGYVGVAYSLANLQFPGDCGATSASETLCSLNQSGNILIYNLGFDNLNPISAYGFLVGWSVVFFFASWLVLARPWDKGPIELAVAGPEGIDGLIALEKISKLEQQRYLVSISTCTGSVNTSSGIASGSDEKEAFLQEAPVGV